jgi:hypothetical protein
VTVAIVPCGGGASFSVVRIEPFDACRTGRGGGGDFGRDPGGGGFDGGEGEAGRAVKDSVVETLVASDCSLEGPAASKVDDATIAGVRAARTSVEPRWSSVTFFFNPESRIPGTAIVLLPYAEIPPAPALEFAMPYPPAWETPAADMAEVADDDEGGRGTCIIM